MHSLDNPTQPFSGDDNIAMPPDVVPTAVAQ